MKKEDIIQGQAEHGACDLRILYSNTCDKELCCWNRYQRGQANLKEGICVNEKVNCQMCGLSGCSAYCPDSRSYYKQIIKLREILVLDKIIHGENKKEHIFVPGYGSEELTMPKNRTQLRGTLYNKPDPIEVLCGEKTVHPIKTLTDYSVAQIAEMEATNRADYLVNIKNGVRTESAYTIERLQMVEAQFIPAMMEFDHLTDISINDAEKLFFALKNELFALLIDDEISVDLCLALANETKLIQYNYLINHRKNMALETLEKYLEAVKNSTKPLELPVNEETGEIESEKVYYISEEEV